uniref:Uncharacterized protein n=1 Tax=Anguilla anguilla TaxID=7936 RepID=A0A0E9U7L9_ANGAN
MKDSRTLMSRADLNLCHEVFSWM